MQVTSVATDRNRFVVGSLGILTLVAVGVVLKQAQSVVLPLIIAWLLSYILGPPVQVMTRRKVPTPLAVALVIVLLLGICYLGAIFLHARISAFVTAYPRYEARLTELIDSIVNSRLGVTYNPFTDVEWSRQVGSFLVKLSGPLFTFMSKLLMVLIFLIFMLLGKTYFQYKIRKALSGERADQVTHILASISSEIGRYLTVQCLISLATGFMVWLALSIIGVDFAITWAALAFFLNFIPTIGSIVASIPPILLAIVQFHPASLPAVATLVSLLAIQVVIGNVISPKVMGDRLNLSPVVVLLSLVFWGWLWGIVGALLSIPIASAIKITCQNIETLRPISIMMGSGKGYRHEFENG